MTPVETALGPVPTAELGLTPMPERMATRSPGPCVLLEGRAA